MERERTVETALRERTAAVLPSLMDWGAILAGTAIAVALMAVFLNFGIALGLSIAPQPAGAERWGMPGWGYAVAIALWLIFTKIAAMASGGYVAGRMRRPADGVVNGETHVRDGMNGLAVWGVASCLIVVVTVWTVAGGFSAASSAVGTAVQSAAASPASAYVADRLLRPGGAAAPAAAAPPGTAGLPAGADDADAVRRILDRTADFTIDDADRTFIAQVIARRTGLTDEAARQRIDEVLGRFAEEAERARRYGIIAAFVTAVTALIAAAAAWSAAVLGGAHRDGRSARELKASRAW